MSPKKILLALLLSMPFIGTANAGENFFYWGITAGQVLFDSDIVLEDPTNVGIVLGYEFADHFAFEAEYTITAAKGKFTTADKFEIETLAAYGIMRIPIKSDVYFKIKAGIIQEKTTEKVDQTNPASVSFGNADDSESGSSYGIGIGVRFDKDKMFQIEYTIVDTDDDPGEIMQDINFLSISYLF